MSIWDIINPWGALRQEREISGMRDAFIGRLIEQRKELEQKLRTANDRADNNSLSSLRNANDAARYKKMIREGHFRNPKTGRLGRKGETFQ